MRMTWLMDGAALRQDSPRGTEVSGQFEPMADKVKLYCELMRSRPDYLTFE